MSANWMKGPCKTALVVDASGNVTVTGSAWNGSSLDYHTVQYDNTGAMLWEMGYNDKYNFTDAPMDIALTNDGGVVVTGQCLNPDTTWSYVTVKYLAHEFVMPVDSDSVSTSLRWLTNRDQLLDTDTNVVERVKFYSNQCYPNLYFMPDTLSYVFFQGVDTTNDDTLHRIDMTFNGANADQKLLPMGKESYWNNYYLGHIPEGRPFVSLHERLVKQDVWPNIDVIYSSNQRGLKYYIVVHPGGEAGAISLEYHGYDALSVDGNEALVIESSIGELVQPQALAYEMDANGELDLLGWQPEYKVTSGEVVFEELGEWDGDLVIEVNWGYFPNSIAANLPEWGTPYGDSGQDAALDIDTDENGNLYATGETQSANFPVTGPYSGSFRGLADAFIGKFQNNYLRHWVSFYGSDGIDFGQGVAAEDQISNTVYACGYTYSWSNLPLATTSQPNTYFVGSNGSTSNGFIVGLEIGTGLLKWATYFGANGGECKDVAVDPLGSVYVVGTTSQTGVANTCLSTSVGTNFPICDQTGFSQGSNHGNRDGFIAKFNSQSQLVWSTLFGGDDYDELWAIAIDNHDHRVYAAGKTLSDDIEYYDYLTSCPSIAGNGLTLCQETSVGYFQTELNGSNNSFSPDGLIAKFTLDGDLLWSTLFGGNGTEEIHGIAARPTEQGQSLQYPRADVWITGLTSTNSYMTTSCLEPSSGDDAFPGCVRWPQLGQYTQDYCNQCTGNPGDQGGNEAFVARFSRQGKLEWSTFLGGGKDDGWMGQRAGSPKVSVAVDGMHFVAGGTFSGSAGSTPISIVSSPGSSLYDQPDHANLATTANTDGFIMGFDEGSRQIYGSFYGGTKLDAIWGISTHDDRVFIAGDTRDDQNDLPSTPSVQYYMAPNMAPQTKDAFFAQIQSIVIPVAADLTVEVQARIVAYPNPASGEISISWNSIINESVEISIVNGLGYEVDSRSVRALVGTNKETLSIRSLPSGIYLVTLEGRETVDRVKIVKQ